MGNLVIHKHSINQSKRYIKDGYRFEHKKQLMKRLLITYLTHVDRNKKKVKERALLIGLC